MPQQLQAILWAQWRVLRNHGRRGRAIPALLLLLLAIWYGVFAFFAVALALLLPTVPLSELRPWFGFGCFALFVLWQSIPLLTLSGGWSLQLDRLQVYPLRTRTLLAIEVGLRILMSADLAMPVLGAAAGLMRNDQVPHFLPVLLIGYIPFNALVASGTRAAILYSFARYRAREAVAVLLLSLGVLPQLLLRTTLGSTALPYLRMMGNAPGLPWTEVAHLVLGEQPLRAAVLCGLWLGAAAAFAYWLTVRSLRSEQLNPGRSSSPAVAARSRAQARVGLLERSLRLVPDPQAALLQKEITFLLRAPRFRVVFGMACIFSIAVFLPLTIGGTPGSPFLRVHFVPTIGLYGVLLLGDVLMWNIFGFDQAAAALYFTSPLQLRSVILAKNTVAAGFVLCQTLIVLLLAASLRLFVTPISVLTTLCATSVVTIYFLAIGNLLSVSIPRPIDPRQTLRKQAGASVQIWLLVCVLVAAALIGFAALPGWALQADWPFPLLLLLEFGIGIGVYRIALDSAATRGLQRREVILAALSRAASPIAS